MDVDFDEVFKVGSHVFGFVDVPARSRVVSLEFVFLAGRDVGSEGKVDMLDADVGHRNDGKQRHHHNLLDAINHEGERHGGRVKSPVLHIRLVESCLLDVVECSLRGIALC